MRLVAVLVCVGGWCLGCAGNGVSAVHDSGGEPDLGSPVDSSSSDAQTSSDLADVAASDLGAPVAQVGSDMALPPLDLSGGPNGGSAPDAGGDGGPLGWTSVTNPGGDFEAVWAASPDDVWFGPPLTHWFHGTFTQYLDVDPVEQLSGTGASDVYSHGVYTYYLGGEPRPWGALFHWDGVAWTKQSDTPPPISLYARTASDLYVNGNGPMMRSSDQGRTWTNVSVPDPCGSTDAFAGSGVELVSFVGCNPGVSYFNWSRDGGATWTVGDVALDHARTMAVLAGTAYFSGYTVANDTEQFLRTDDGVSFKPLDVGSVVDTIWLDSPDEVWIAGYDTAVRHSLDGGVTWTVERTETIRSIYAVGAHDLFAVGPNGTLLHLAR